MTPTLAQTSAYGRWPPAVGAGQLDRRRRGRPNYPMQRRTTDRPGASGKAAAGKLLRTDRATRDQLDAAELFKRAERNGWRLLDCDRADSGDDSQRLLADIRIAVAAEERRKISQRTREGLARARRAGVQLGRPSRIPAEVIVRIVELNRQGRSAQAIAKQLTAEGVPTPGAVRGGRTRRCGQPCAVTLCRAKTKSNIGIDVAYIRTQDTKQTSRGKVVKRYEVVYRAKVREHGRAATLAPRDLHHSRVVVRPPGDPLALVASVARSGRCG
jgi:hypothetical protein